MSPRQMFRSKVGWTSAAAVLTVAAVLTGTMLASAAGPALPKRTPAQLLLALRNARPPATMTAVITQTANLGFPSLPNIAGLNNSVFSAASLISGTHTADLWYAGPRHVRIALPVSFGETDLRVNGDQAWVWNSHGQTATHYLLPAPKTQRVTSAYSSTLSISVPTPQQAVDQLLAEIGKTTKVTVAGTTQVAGRSAYQLVLAPHASQSLVDRIVIAVDGQTSLPLQLQVFAKGVTSPAFQVGYTSLNFAKPAMSNFTFTPPAGAHVKTVHVPDLGAPGLFGPPRKVSPTFASPARSFAGPPPVFVGRPVGARTGKHGLVRMKVARVVAVAPTSGMVESTQSGVQVMGSDWLSVAVIPASAALTGQESSGWSNWKASPDSKVPHGPRQYVAPISHLPGPSALGQLASLLPALLKAATPVHGAWGSGRLLRTNLLSVLVTSNGKVLIGAVTPAVLYADAAKAK
jgi:outer membrane lipoprotein-sorting protein